MPQRIRHMLACRASYAQCRYAIIIDVPPLRHTIRRHRYAYDTISTFRHYAIFAAATPCARYAAVCCRLIDFDMPRFIELPAPLLKSTFMFARKRYGDISCYERC